MDVYIERRLKSYEDYIRFFYNEIKIKNKRIEELETELQEVKSENKSLKEENRKNSGKINADWLKASSKACSEALKFEKSLDKFREFLESDTEKCDNRYITDYPNFQELIDKDRLKDLESKKVEDLTLNDCIEECLIRLDLGQDKHKGELFKIDLTRYFHLLGHREEQNYVTDSIVDEGYDEVLLNIKTVGIIGYGLKHEVTLKVRIPE
ncbi:hypothetical protein CYK72_16120 [Clostridium perfringens]|uniref:hypothetical protein n=1 Tax=Clostridium perfringens TaxID=1502 RepID=UPI000D710587|nr:hypothetical protein [Clostridium perfringens]MBO3392517.1 hypothetical protein [Clostridium perfringens]PWX44888.1 hypothetical protein CYK72_16120 [Clostridium perfringens]